MPGPDRRFRRHRARPPSEALIDLDDDALSEAAVLFGTKTKKDTVNTALREAALRLKRLQGLEQLAAMGQAGDFDELLDKRNYRK